MKKIMLIIVVLSCSVIAMGQPVADTTNKAQVVDGSVMREMIKADIRKKNTPIVHTKEYWDSVNLAERKKFNSEIIRKFGPKLGKKIAAGEIEIGFTETMVEYAWGSADDYIYTTTKKGRIVTWVYKRQQALLAFKNKKLISIIE